jgi:hypothetical protein
MNYLNNFVGGGGFKLPEQASTRLENMMETGGAGGKPTEMMYDMTRYGGVPGAGLDAINAMMAYGAPSQVGQYMSNAAQFGIPSEAGRFLYNRAAGVPTAALSYLAPYMGKR